MDRDFRRGKAQEDVFQASQGYTARPCPKRDVCKEWHPSLSVISLRKVLRLEIPRFTFFPPVRLLGASKGV